MVGLSVKHLIIELSRRDDLESLMYLLVYLAQGFLPWIGCNNNNNSIAIQTSMVKEYKLKLKGEDLCKDLPSKLPFITSIFKSYRIIRYSF